jgi:cation transport regulator
MPYQTIQDLPDAVKNVLPQHAQEIYKEAFNHALQEYKDPKERRVPKESAEVVAHKVAWSAVKKEYVKDDKTKHWVKKH